MKIFQQAITMAFADDAFYFAEGDGPPQCVPAYALIDAQSKVLEIGEEAAKIQPTPPPPLQRVRMISHGAAYEIFVMNQFMRRALAVIPKALFKKRLAVMAVPSHRPASRSMREVVMDVAREVYLIEHGMASAVGLDLPWDSTPQAVLSINEDWCEFVVMHLGQAMGQVWLPIGLASFVEDCRIHLRQARECLADSASLRAQLVKDGIGPGMWEPISAWETWLGRNEIGRQKTETLSPEIFAVGIMPSLLRITQAVSDAIAKFPPDVRLAVGNGPMHLCGCGAHPPGIPEVIGAQLGLAMITHRDPIHPALLGVQKALGQLDTLKAVHITRRPTR